jgi:hypothetical protein
MDASDDEYGDDFFDVWAEHDLDDAIADQEAGESGVDVFDPWAELDSCNHDDEEAEESGGDDVFDPREELDDSDKEDTIGSTNGSEVPAFEEDACSTQSELHSSSTDEGTLAKLFSAYYYDNKQVTTDEQESQEASWAGVFRDMYCKQGAANTVPAFEQFLNLVKADTELSQIVLSLKPNLSVSYLLVNKLQIEKNKGVANSNCFEDQQLDCD